MKTRHTAFAAALLLAFLAVPRAVAAQTFAFEYAVKVVCGRPDVFTVPGVYATTINVHNPSREETRFRFKVAVATPLQQGNITPFRDLGLRSDGALAITCRQVREMTGLTNMDGFVVIQTLIDMDVTAVYTAAGTAAGAPVSTMDVERQTPRRMQ